MSDPRTVLDFWFSERARALWFERDRDFDAEIAARFGAAVHDAQRGGFDSWRVSPEGCLALLILLDQMPRNIYRGAAKAFLGDARARDVADAAIQRGFDCALPFERRRFFYLPFEHAEDLADQDRAVDLFTRALAEASPAEQEAAEVQLDYAHRHREVIRRVGRFPGRNAALGRITSEAEQAILADPKYQF
ncbi:MAG: DUF924 domain-containing protein [Rhodospirillaceae bacterium]|nr:DUF924 domain-containing protein [Rhodospirillaceae bacterium]